jgi:hypothetical protein
MRLNPVKNYSMGLKRLAIRLTNYHYQIKYSPEFREQEASRSGGIGRRARFRA